MRTDTPGFERLTPLGDARWEWFIEPTPEAPVGIIRRIAGPQASGSRRYDWQVVARRGGWTVNNERAARAMRRRELTEPWTQKEQAR